MLFFSAHLVGAGEKTVNRPKKTLKVDQGLEDRFTELDQSKANEVASEKQ